MQPNLVIDRPRRSQPTSHAERPAPQSTRSKPRLQLERRLDGKLWLLLGPKIVAVEVVRCFPWTDPDRFLSLRDAEGTEHGFINNVAELEPSSRAALEPGLLRSGFVLEITCVLSVTEDFELRSFEVETLQGRRKFQTALDAWPRELEDGGLVLQDVFGDLYRVSNVQRLDPKSIDLLSAFIG